MTSERRLCGTIGLLRNLGLLSWSRLPPMSTRRHVQKKELTNRPSFAAHHVMRWLQLWFDFESKAVRLLITGH